MSQSAKAIKIVSDNRKASFLYEILEKYEAGIALYGPEIKSVKTGKVNISDGYVIIKNEEALLLNVHISPYTQANRENKDPVRTRSLLLHKHEILRLLGKVKEKNLTIIPLKMYLTHGKAKIEIGLAKGKKLYDKREDLKKKDQTREIERALKSHHKKPMVV
ncbi:MAG: SsrA-binding protein SmpB [Candidatus Acididesulfobacter guangdongensis]|uniref:SsrA-binding protein n=1 Tax=Acididesulfobacter guangdongensis TaxID=2597225 RepID=A0A519BGW9_ACIG2|nr:MAG: SsrA-binding protein SmpB [Candidatus Acididesulfobacter guangdongensis]